MNRQSYEGREVTYDGGKNSRAGVQHLQVDKCHTLKEVRHFSRGALFEVRKSVYSSKCVLSLLSAISSSHFQTFSCLELATPHLRTIYRLKRAVAHRRPRIGFDGVAILGVVVFAAYTLANAHYETDIGDAECAANVPPSTISLDQSYITKEIVRTLNQEGVVVIKNVLQRSELISARAAAMNVLTEGRLNYAGGNSISVRQDKVCFVRGSDGTAEGADKEARGHSPIGLGLQHCISLLRGTTQRLQELGYDRSINHKVPMQCQLAHYAGNGNSSYTAHRDAASDTNFYEIGLLAWLRAKDYRRRSITAILYLNEADWDASPDVDGGSLKCYIQADSEDVTGSTATRVDKVCPTGGTLVLFDSRYLLHEVEPSHRDRLALTLWVVGDKNEAAI